MAPLTVHPLTVLWQLVVALSIVGAFYLYLPSWRRLRRARRDYGVASPNFPGAEVSELVRFLIGLLALAAATLTPLHYLAAQLFPAAVLQHLLLIAVAPALLWSADPLPIMARTLSPALVARLKETLAPTSGTGEWLRRATHRGVVWFCFVGAVWLWYDPAIHAAARRHESLHVLELTTLFGAALPYWWHITMAAPRLHRPLPDVFQMLYTASGALPVKVMGAGAIFGSQVVYAYPAQALAEWGVSAADNQLWGGALIWMVGGITFTTAAGVLLRRWISREAEKPALTVEQISRGTHLLAPGAEQRRDDPA